MKMYTPSKFITGENICHRKWMERAKGKRELEKLREQAKLGLHSN